MRERIRLWWTRLRSGLWFAPLLLILAACALAATTLALDRTGHFQFYGIPWFRELTNGQARDLVSTVATSVLSATSVVFSMTIVVLTLATSQLGPRLVRGFTEEKVTQLTLGGSVATFVYSLLILSSLDSTLDSPAQRALSISVTVALTLGTIVMLVIYLHSLSVSIQVSSVLAKVANQLDGALDRLLFDDDNTKHAAELEADTLQRKDETATAQAILADGSGYVQFLDLDDLVHQAEKHKGDIDLTVRPGHFVAPGQIVAYFHPLGHPPAESQLDDDAVRCVRSSIHLGFERTISEDAEFALLQLVDVALRALSPGINDPQTATISVDHLGAALARVAPLRFRPATRLGSSSEFRVTFPGFDFEGLVNAAFLQVRQCATTSPALLIRILEALTNIRRQTFSEDRAECLMRHAEIVRQVSRDNLEVAADREDVEERYAKLEALHASRSSIES